MSVFYGTHNLPRFREPVLTIGTFDGVHSGHLSILARLKEEAARRGGESVLITFDPHPRTVLQPGARLQVITPLPEKIKLLEGAGIDHIVVVPFTPAFASLTAEEYIRTFLVEKFHPAALVIGYDHHFGRGRDGSLATLERQAPEHGYAVVEIPARLIDDAAVSSTKIRTALSSGNVSAAAAMLGRAYGLGGVVVHGDAIGRTIGYPTANLAPSDATQAVPRDGIYAARATLADGSEWPAMVSIGVRPTVTSSAERKIEAALLDFSGDLYGQQLTLHFVEWLRGEQKFDSLGALTAAIAQDEVNARKILLR